MFIKVYHITFRSNRESILTHGLLPAGAGDERCRWRLGYNRCVFISTKCLDRMAMAYVQWEGVDCWEFIVLSRHLKKDPYSHNRNHYYITHPITAYALRLVKEIGYAQIDWSKYNEPSSDKDVIVIS